MIDTAGIDKKDSNNERNTMKSRLSKLTQVLRGYTTRKGMITDGIHLKDGFATVTNYDVTVVTKFDCELPNEGIVVNSSELYQASQKADIASIEKKDGDSAWVVSHMGKKSINLTGNADDYPSVDDCSEHSVTLTKENVDVLCRMEKHLSDDSRRSLNNICIQAAGNKSVAIACNGHTLYKYIICDMTKDFDQMLIPGVFKSVQNLMKIHDDDYAVVGKSNDHHIIESDRFRVITRVPERRYPDWTQVIPVGNAENIIVLDANDTITKLQYLNGTDSCYTKFVITDGVVRLTQLYGNNGLTEVSGYADLTSASLPNPITEFASHSFRTSLLCKMNEMAKGRKLPISIMTSDDKLIGKIGDDMTVVITPAVPNN